MIIQGFFRDGQLKIVEDITFSDGLKIRHPNINLNCYKPIADFSSWTYLGEDDRRFINEIKNFDLEPVGPSSYLTNTRPSRIVEKNSYDTEEGIYKPHSGFIWNITYPKTHIRFVSCDKEREMIIENFRKGPSNGPVEGPEYIPEDPKPMYKKRILHCNLKAMKELDGDITCNCKQKADRDRYFQQLCDFENSKLTADNDEHTKEIDLNGIQSADSLTTPDSLSDISINEDISNICSKANVMRKKHAYTLRSHNSVFSVKRSTPIKAVIEYDLDTLKQLMLTRRANDEKSSSVPSFFGASFVSQQSTTSKK